MLSEANKRTKMLNIASQRGNTDQYHNEYHPIKMAKIQRQRTTNADEDMRKGKRLPTVNEHNNCIKYCADLFQKLQIEF